MSSFYAKTKHPKTGEFEVAFWLDDHFGRHRYGVVFSDATYHEDDLDGDIEMCEPLARDSYEPK